MSDKENIEATQEAEAKLAVEEQEEMSERDVVQGYREVNIKPFGLVKILRPNFDQATEGDCVYSAKRGRLLLESDKTKKLLSRRALSRVLEGSEDWTPKDDKEIEQLMRVVTEHKIIKEQLSVCLQALIDNPDDEQTSEMVGQLAKKYDVTITVLKKSKKIKFACKPLDRHSKGDVTALATFVFDVVGHYVNESIRKYMVKIQERETQFSDCIENYAHYERQIFLLSECVRNADGKKIWDNIDVVKKLDTATLITVMKEAIRTWSGPGDEDVTAFFDELPVDRIPDYAGE